MERLRASGLLRTLSAAALSLRLNGSCLSFRDFTLSWRRSVRNDAGRSLFLSDSVYLSCGQGDQRIGFSVRFRFNTYIGFAICLRLFGDNGFSLLAMLIAIWVPISNVIAVSALASAVTSEKSLGKRMQKVLLQVFKNPLIIATLLGLFFNVFGLRLPDFLTASLKSLGNASLAAGLLCIGASLTLRDLESEVRFDFRMHRTKTSDRAAYRLVGRSCVRTG